MVAGAKDDEEQATEVGSMQVFPSVRKDDPEDVSWALSTAEAMWSRGDYDESVKWIRRAAEAASECERDDRALELAKTAADLKGLPADRAAQVVLPKPVVALGTPTSPPITVRQPQPPPLPAGAKRSAPPPPPVPLSGAKPPVPPAPPSSKGAPRGLDSGRPLRPRVEGDENRPTPDVRLMHGDSETTSEVEVPVIPDRHRPRPPVPHHDG
jgi:hypothetical protein